MRKRRTRLTPLQVRAIARAYTGTPENIARLARLYQLGPRQPRLIARRGGNPMAAKTRSRFTPEELAVVRARYADTDTATLARELRRSLLSVYQAAAKMGLKKSAEYRAALAAELGKGLQESGRAHRFQKGQVPPNKGLRRPGWAPGRMGATQFKKGERNGKAAQHFLPIGAEREIEGYLYRKVSDVPNVPYTVNWKLVHHLAWMERHGPVPPGHVLRFKDGDKRNTAVENLELVTHAENLKGNSIHRYPPEVREVIRLQARLERTIERSQAA